MKVLIGCETSGAIRREFEKLGHDVLSCDLLPSDDNSPLHYQGDVFDLLENQTFDLIVIHPPCTALCLSGNRWYGKGKEKHHERLKAIEWTKKLWEKCKEVSYAVALENPASVVFQHLDCDTFQYIQPWQFGHGETKRTGFALHNLPKLIPTDIVEGREQRIWKMGPSPERWKERSKTFEGIAKAIASQWSNQ